MAQHKWHKEIKAWADGAEIEFKHNGWNEGWNDTGEYPNWWNVAFSFRIKPQPKEPQYLYVYDVSGEIMLWPSKTLTESCIGKIKLEEE